MFNYGGMNGISELDAGVTTIARNDPTNDTNFTEYQNYRVAKCDEAIRGPDSTSLDREVERAHAAGMPPHPCLDFDVRHQVLRRAAFHMSLLARRVNSR